MPSTLRTATAGGWAAIEAMAGTGGCVTCVTMEVMGRERSNSLSLTLIAAIYISANKLSINVTGLTQPSRLAQPSLGAAELFGGAARGSVELAY